MSNTIADESIEKKIDLELFEGRKLKISENTQKNLQLHKEITNGILRFRFPPEPNGYLHIGHAKSMKLNFGQAKAWEGVCILRFDDTNPKTESQEYIDNIIDVVEWLGWKPNKITYSSDYFDIIYDKAVELIKNGLAYVDFSTSSEISKQRRDRFESPFRNSSIEKNSELFEKMKNGEIADGECTLRLKMDMKSDNPNMRDIIAYRVKHSVHHRTHNKWCIYPTYDFTHCIVDSLEHIDYSLCTLEFETRRESYYWLLDVLNMYKPKVWEFSRLDLNGALTSKRKIKELIDSEIVDGWDYPQLFTITGLRKRGVSPQTINNFIEDVGLTRNSNKIEIEKFNYFVRQELDLNAPRAFMVLDPLKVNIINWTESYGDMLLTRPNYPRYSDKGSRTLRLSQTIFIEKVDFRLTDEKKYYGLAPNKWVGLKYGPHIKCEDVKLDDKGDPVEINVTIDFEKSVKVKQYIHWVANNSLKMTVKLYNNKPSDYESMFIESVYNECLAEKYLETTKLGDKFQFERCGYYIRINDSTSDDSTNDTIHFTQIISLKDSKRA